MNDNLKRFLESLAEDFERDIESVEDTMPNRNEIVAKTNMIYDKLVEEIQTWAMELDDEEIIIRDRLADRVATTLVQFRSGDYNQWRDVIETVITAAWLFKADYDNDDSNQMLRDFGDQ